MSIPARPGQPGSDGADGGPAHLLEMLTKADQLDDFLTDLACLATADVEAASACGLTVRADPASRLLAAASDEFAHRMDEVQYLLEDGPCLTALRDNTIVDVPDIAGDPRWPHLAERGRAQGVGASLSVPLSVGGRAVAALNLYARTAHAFTGADRDRATRLAADAAGAVALAARMADHEERIRHLHRALTSRSMIDHATGILMGRYRITAEEAFEVLKQGSQNTNTKIRDIANNLIHETTGQATLAQDPEPDPEPEPRAAPKENS